MKLKIYAPPERKVIADIVFFKLAYAERWSSLQYSTWIGGSILAGLGTFKKVSYSPYPVSHGIVLKSLGLRRCGFRPRNIKRILTSSIASHSRRVNLVPYIHTASSVMTTLIMTSMTTRPLRPLDLVVVTARCASRAEREVVDHSRFRDKGTSAVASASKSHRPDHLHVEQF